MKYKIVLSADAKNELEDIGFYIAIDNPERSKTFITELQKHFVARLEDMPLACPKVKGEVRMLPYGRYGVLFIVDEFNKIVKVLHIFSGGQNWFGWFGVNPL